MSDRKVALVTGASRGIGRATAACLAEAGWDLLLVARSGALLEQAAAEESGRHGAAAACHAADLREPPAAEAAVAAALERFGRLDLLVNCAGATKRGDFFALSEEDFADGFALKYHGAVRLTRAAWPQLRANAGQMINIIGIGAHTPTAEFTIGASVNAALVAFTKAMADRGLAEGVRVNAIHPGAIATGRLTSRIDALARQEGLDPAAARARMAEQQGITRFGEPEEIGRAVVFLASPAAAYVHGAFLDVDGGARKGV